MIQLYGRPSKASIKSRYQQAGMYRECFQSPACVCGIRDADADGPGTEGRLWHGQIKWSATDRISLDLAVIGKGAS